jgi:hypothetical protein
MTTTPDWITEETDRRIFEAAFDKVVTVWGMGCAARLGPVVYRALLSQAVLEIITVQSESAAYSDATIRRLVDGAGAWIDSKIRR